MREIEDFLEIYKRLENRPTEVRGWLGTDDASRIFGQANARAAAAGGRQQAPGAEPAWLPNQSIARWMKSAICPRVSADRGQHAPAAAGDTGRSQPTAVPSCAEASCRGG
jgi:hypothetical protein